MTNRIITAKPFTASIAALCVVVGLSTATAKPKTTEGPIPEVEYAYQQLNPDLYEAARKYFPDNTPGAAPKRLFRLTREQLDATVAALLPTYATQSIKASMARDPLQTNYEYAELLSVNPANFSALSRWISEIAGRVRQNPSGLVNCEASKNSDSCLSEAARAFTVKAFRGDVAPEKLNQVATFFTTGVKTVGVAQAAGDLVEIVLNSPRFLFRQELETNERNRLAPAQLLQAVTYTIADAPPEALQLSSSRAAEYLRNGTEAGPTIDAIVSSKESRAKLVRFFKAWLEIKDPSEFTISTETFREFTPALAAAMVDETDKFLAAQLSKSSPTLKDVTQTAQSFVSKALEDIYKVKAEDPAGQKATKLNPSQRLGIFSLPGVIASHSGPTDSRPMKRGVFWVRKAMCMDMQPPPPDFKIEDYPMTGKTQRERIESVTKAPACLGCHQLIDPFAFFQENYDALGRFRTTENGAPINPAVSIDFLDEGVAKPGSTVEALKTFTNSMMFKQCFVRQMFRFYMGRNEEPSDDALLRRMFFEFAHNDEQDILKLVYMLTSSDRIVRRQ